jgi:MerR family transcriptional regulator, mercuric resistance operon regulatory protein
MKRAQALGMSLEEVRRLIKIDTKGTCKETRDLAVAQLALVERKLAELARLRDVLHDLVKTCDQRPRGS